VPTRSPRTIKLEVDEEEEILVLERRVPGVAPRPLAVLPLAEVEEQLRLRMSAKRASSSATHARVISPGWGSRAPAAVTLEAGFKNLDARLLHFDA